MGVTTRPAPRLRSLAGPTADAYLERLARAIRRARLNAHYPDARAVCSHLEAMTSGVHHGLYPGVRLEPAGLPAYAEWTRVRTDHHLADSILADLGDEAHLRARAAGAPESIHGKQLLKHLYYTRLRAMTVAPLSAMEVHLRRVEPDRRAAHFHVTLDKLDASGPFVRYTLDVSQVSSIWNRPLITLAADHASHTQALKSLVYRYSHLDAELAFTRLATSDGLHVERVIKGSIGPVWAGPEEAPEALKSAWDDHPDALIATFGLDMATIDVAADGDNDPLEDLLAEQLSPGARAEYEASRQRFGYRVFKDRKFVCTPAARAAVAGLCRAQGTRNIVYGL